MRRVLGLIFVLSIMVPGCFAGNAQWTQVRSPNFTVITDAGEKRGREVALHFEQMRAIFGALFNKAKINSSQPMYILAFRNSKEFREVCPIWKGKAEELAGFFQQGEGVTYIALDTSSEAKWSVIFHEYGHFLLNGNMPEMPPWFEEGFAQFFETVRIQGKSFVVGEIPQSSLPILQQYKWMPLDRLLSVKSDSPEYNERDRQTIFYAESWLAFAHYWFNSPLQKQMIAFLNLSPQGMPVDEAIQKAFGMSALELDQDLRKFFQTGQLRIYTTPMPAGVDNIAMTATLMDEIDGRARVAELKLQQKDHQAEAVQEFEQIVKEKPDHPVALRGLAYAALRRGDQQKAADYFRKAAAQQTDDPHIYYMSAVLLQQMDAQHHPELLQEMEKNLQHAVQLDATFADAYGWLGLAYAWQGKWDEAIPPAQKAVELSPRNDQWRMNLAGFYANAKRYDDALKLWGALKSSKNPTLAMQAAMSYNSLADYQAKMAEYEKQGGQVIVAEEKNDAVESTPDERQPPVLKKRGQRPDAASDEVLNFFSGTLLGVSCSGKQATFMITNSSSLLTLVAPDIYQVSFSGKQTFSCGLRGLKVKGFYSKKTSGNQVQALEFEESAAGK